MHACCPNSNTINPVRVPWCKKFQGHSPSWPVWKQPSWRNRRLCNRHLKLSHDHQVDLVVLRGSLETACSGSVQGSYMGAAIRDQTQQSIRIFWVRPWHGAWLCCGWWLEALVGECQGQYAGWPSMADNIGWVETWVERLSKTCLHMIKVFRQSTENLERLCFLTIVIPNFQQSVRRPRPTRRPKAWAKARFHQTACQTARTAALQTLRSSAPREHDFRNHDKCHHYIQCFQWFASLMSQSVTHRYRKIRDDWDYD